MNKFYFMPQFTFAEAQSKTVFNYWDKFQFIPVILNKLYCNKFLCGATIKLIA